MMVSISVVIPTFNSSNTIVRCIDSILCQVGIGIDFDLEILIFDDCSTDNTLVLLNSFDCLNIYKSIKNSGGPNKGRNMGLRKSSGDWIVFVDHDDEWVPNRIMEQLKYKDYNIITCGYNVYLNGVFSDKVLNYSEDQFIEYNRNETFRNKLSRNPKSQISYFGTFLFKSHLKDMFLEEEFGKCDFDFILKLFQNQITIEVCAPLINRYVNKSNLSLNEQYRLEDYKISLDILNHFKFEYPKEVGLGIYRLNAALGRYYYYLNNGKKARPFFLKSRKSITNFILYFTSFGFSRIVNRYIKVFG